MWLAWRVHILLVDGSALSPRHGEPRWLVHRIETSNFTDVQGQVALYAGWEELNEAIQTLLAGIKTVAMEYSPNAEIPYISRVDAGTLEWIRSFGIEVQTSAELAQRVEARLSECASNRTSNLCTLGVASERLRFRLDRCAAAGWEK